MVPNGSLPVKKNVPNGSLCRLRAARQGHAEPIPRSERLMRAPLGGNATASLLLTAWSFNLLDCADLLRSDSDSVAAWQVSWQSQRGSMF